MGKTKEELKAANVERQRRWREKHKWLGEQRRLRNYGKSAAQLAITHNGAEVTKIEVEDPETGEGLTVWVDGRTRIGRVVLLLWRQVQGKPDMSGREGRDGIEVAGF